MAKQWSLDELKALSVHDRATLYKNASRLAHMPEARSLKKLIEEAGLPFSDDACLTMDDPITVKMHEIINSPEGRAAAVKAVKDGLPAMAGIDPMLQIALAGDYGAHNMGTATAGGLVGELMQSLGYRKDKQKALPEGCVAKTAATWT